MAAAPFKPSSVKVDWLEDENAHILKIDIPGMKKEDVKAQVIGENTLQITGFRREEDNPFGKWHIKERPRGAFSREFNLPKNVNLEAINARDENGILTVTIPKIKRIRNIPISTL